MQISQRYISSFLNVRVFPSFFHTVFLARHLFADDRRRNVTYERRYEAHVAYLTDAAGLANTSAILHGGERTQRAK